MPRPWGQEGAWQGLGVRSSMWSVGQGEIVEGQANPAGPGRCGEGLGVQEGMWGDQARDGHAISMEEGVATAGTDGRQRGGQTGGHSLAQHGVRQLELSRRPHGGRAQNKPGGHQQEQGWRAEVHVTGDEPGMKLGCAGCILYSGPVFAAPVCVTCDLLTASHCMCVSLSLLTNRELCRDRDAAPCCNS